MVNVTLEANDVTFEKTVDSSTLVNIQRSLTVNTSGSGITTFGGAVGTTFDLASVSTNSDGSTRLNGGSVTTSGDQIFNDAVTLEGGATTLTTPTANFGNDLNPGRIDRHRDEHPNHRGQLRLERHRPQPERRPRCRLRPGRPAQRRHDGYRRCRPHPQPRLHRCPGDRQRLYHHQPE